MKSNPVICQLSEYFLDLEGDAQSFSHRKRSAARSLTRLQCHNYLPLTGCPPTDLSVMKDYLPQLLENEQTVSCSHYKRLIRSGGVPLFNISDSANSKLIDCILGMIYKTLSESVRAAFRKYLILDGTQWKRGEKFVHLLTLCIVYHEIAIPIYWRPTLGTS